MLEHNVKLMDDFEVLMGIFSPYKLRSAELKVAHWLLKGLAFTEIAVQLGLQPRTVKSYASVVYKRTGCTTRSQFMSKFQAEFTTLKLYSGLMNLIDTVEHSYVKYREDEAERERAMRLKLANCSAAHRSSVQIRDAFVALAPAFGPKLGHENLQLLLNQLLSHLKLN